MPGAPHGDLAVDEVLAHEVGEDEPAGPPLLLDERTEARALRHHVAVAERRQELGVLPRVHAARQFDGRQHAVLRR